MARPRKINVDRIVRKNMKLYGARHSTNVKMFTIFAWGIMSTDAKLAILASIKEIEEAIKSNPNTIVDYTFGKRDLLNEFPLENKTTENDK